jgi:hypothetical protein
MTRKLRRASRMAENMFERDAEVTAFWLAETAGGRQQTILTPMDVRLRMCALTGGWSRPCEIAPIGFP